MMFCLPPPLLPHFSNLLLLDEPSKQMFQADRGKTLTLLEFVSSNCNTKAQIKESNSSYTLGISAKPRTCLQLGWVLERGSCWVQGCAAPPCGVQMGPQNLQLLLQTCTGQQRTLAQCQCWGHGKLYLRRVQGSLGKMGPPGAGGVLKWGRGCVAAEGSLAGLGACLVLLMQWASAGQPAGRRGPGLLLQSQPVWQICCWPVLASPPSLQPAGRRCRLCKHHIRTMQGSLKAGPDERTGGRRDAQHPGRVIQFNVGANINLHEARPNSHVLQSNWHLYAMCHTCRAAQNGAKGAGLVDECLVHHTVLGTAEARVS